MVQRKKYIIGNWKMNLNVHDSSMYLHKLDKSIKPHRDVEVILAPTMLALQTMSMQVDRHKFKLAAQNLFWRDFGAFTGEVSATQLRGVVDYALIGHSERRHKFNETSRDTRNKVQATLRNKITPVLCIGETLDERTNNETYDTLHDQLVTGLANVTSSDVGDVIIAYEPVWAIGTGNNATPRDVADAVAAIRKQIKHLFGAKAADDQYVLYGGSAKADSATDYLNTPGVDGILVGGASLNSHEFTSIVQKAYTSSR